MLSSVLGAEGRLKKKEKKKILKSGKDIQEYSTVSPSINPPRILPYPPGLFNPA